MIIAVLRQFLHPGRVIEIKENLRLDWVNKGGEMSHFSDMVSLHQTDLHSLLHIFRHTHTKCCITKKKKKKRKGEQVLRCCTACLSTEITWSGHHTGTDESWISKLEIHKSQRTSFKLLIIENPKHYIMNINPWGDIYLTRYIVKLLQCLR